MTKAPYREELFSKLIGALLKVPAARLIDIAEEAEINKQTLNNWLYGSTMNPHLNTIMRVSRAMGYEVTLAKPKKQLRRVA